MRYLRYSTNTRNVGQDFCPNGRAYTRRHQSLNICVGRLSRSIYRSRCVRGQSVVKAGDNVVKEQWVARFAPAGFEFPCSLSMTKRLLAFAVRNSRVEVNK